MIGVSLKHQTLLLLRRACQLCFRSRKRCITELAHHSAHGLGARARPSLQNNVPREAAEGCFQDLHVRRESRELRGRGTGEGVAVQNRRVTAGVARWLA